LLSTVYKWKGRNVSPLRNLNVYLRHVRIDRRKFLEHLSALMVTQVLASSQEGSAMYGLIAKLTVVPGRRDEMITILKESAAELPGCFSYVVAKDSTDENVIWVTEVWESSASHAASLALPAVKDAMVRGKALLAIFDRMAVTNPVWGVGLGAVHGH